MPDPLANFLNKMGVTPWQLILGISAIASRWAPEQPITGQLAQLSTTVQSISTKVEIHSVMLNEMKQLREDMNGLRKDFSSLEVRVVSSKAP